MPFDTIPSRRRAVLTRVAASITPATVVERKRGWPPALPRSPHRVRPDEVRFATEEQHRTTVLKLPAGDLALVVLTLRKQADLHERPRNDGTPVAAERRAWAARLRSIAADIEETAR